jgi:uncharacterized membrane protein (UPF0127 family)/Flp pilus assembly protein TadG
MPVINVTKKTWLATTVRKADTFLSRFVGLLHREKLGPEEVLWLVPSKAIHTIGMKFSIDAVFLNKDHKVVGIIPDLAPRRVTRFYLRAHSVLELPSGTVRKSRTELGDQLDVSMVEPWELDAVMESRPGHMKRESAGSMLRSKSQKGQAITEFSLALLLFLTAFFAIVEFSHLFYVKLTLQHALKEAGRYMVTGRADMPNEATPDPADMMPRQQSIEAVFDKWLMGTGAGLQSFTMTCGGDDCGGGAPTASYSEPVRVTLTATFTKPFFTPLFTLIANGPITFSVSTTWVNEPFGSGIS